MENLFSMGKKNTIYGKFYGWIIMENLSMLWMIEKLEVSINEGTQ
jgi:capsular polysaccharide biosynthesis protein